MTRIAPAAPFAHLLGFGRKPKAAPPSARSDQPNRRAKASAERPKIRAGDYAHLLAEPAAPSPHQRTAAPGAAAAVAAYQKATGQAGASNQEPKRGSAAAHAVALYRRLKGI